MSAVDSAPLGAKDEVVSVNECPTVRIDIPPTAAVDARGLSPWEVGPVTVPATTKSRWWQLLSIQAVRFPPTLIKALQDAGCKTIGDVAVIEHSMPMLRGFTKKHRETVRDVLAVFRG